MGLSGHTVIQHTPTYIRVQGVAIYNGVVRAQLFIHSNLPQSPRCSYNGGLLLIDVCAQPACSGVLMKGKNSHLYWHTFTILDVSEQGIYEVRHF